MILVRSIDRSRRTMTVESVGERSPADTQALQRIDDLAAVSGMRIVEAAPRTRTEAGRNPAPGVPAFDFQCASRGRHAHYRIQLPHDLDRLRELNSLLGAILATSELGRHRLPFNVAIYELLANSLEHGRRGGEIPAGDAALRIRISIGDRRIAGIIADRCDPFDPLSPESIKATSSSSRDFGRRGYGLQLVRQILDDFRYRRTRDGNIYLFAKDLKP